MQAHRLRPFARRLRVRGDPLSGAFYGWRIAGTASARRSIVVALPARSPTGPIWTCRRVNGRLHWMIPRQRARGTEIVIEIDAGVMMLASCPTWNGDGGTKPPPHTHGLRVVVIGGQHPGEDTAMRAVQLIQAKAPQLAGARVHLTAVVLANGHGHRAGFTRETPEGLDPNRCWHRDTGDAQLAFVRSLVRSADFVLDVHGDEHADSPYCVAPCASGITPQVRARVDHFLAGFRAAYPHRLARPRAPGAGEDDPGILINWLASIGIPGVMLELPMRLRHARYDCRPHARVVATERRVAEAALRALAAMQERGSPLTQEQP